MKRTLLTFLCVTISHMSYSGALSSIYTHTAMKEKEFRDTYNSSGPIEISNQVQEHNLDGNIVERPESEQIEDSECDCNKIEKEVVRFKAYGLNYLTYSVPTSYDHGDSSIEAQVSLRYNFRDDERLYLHFTNRFDFYVGTRKSSPVIIRDEKIGLMGILSDDFFGWSDKKTIVELGFTHWSNGQRLTVNDGSEISSNEVTKQDYLDAYTNYETGSDQQRFDVDSLSRARNYIEIVVNQAVTPDLTLAISGKYDVFPSAREDDVYGNIDPDAIFRDYDTFNLAGKLSVNNGDFIMAQIRTGLNVEDIDNASLDVSYRYLNTIAPLLFNYHHGPFQRFSDYTRKINVLSVGLELSM